MRIFWASVLACAAAAAVAQQNPLDNLPYPEWKDPGRNKVVWAGSPHFNERPEGTIIDTIVLHHTASSTLSSVVRWFAMEESRVSAHFTVGKDGSIVQHVSTFNRAWHAGVSRDAYGRENLNNFSVGIEIVNKGDGSEDWPEAQVQAVNHVISVIVRRHPIKQIVSHAFIALPPGRKNDPLNYPWERVKRFGLELHP